MYAKVCAVPLEEKDQANQQHHTEANESASERLFSVRRDLRAFNKCAKHHGAGVAEGPHQVGERCRLALSDKEGDDERSCHHPGKPGEAVALFLFHEDTERILE